MLHLEPDDDPVAGRATTVWFEARRRGGAMITAGDCNCTVSVYRGAFKPGAKAISSARARSGTLGRLTAVVKFPAAEAYTLVLSGKPKAGGAFKPFTLTWAVRATCSH